MPIDPSIPLMAGKGTATIPNALSDPSQMNALLGAANSMRGIQAQNALGEAYQQATDPTTGQTDFNKLTGIITQDPRTAPVIGQAVSTAQEQMNRHLQSIGLSAESWRQKIDVLGRALDPLLADPDVVSGKKGIDYGDIIDGMAKISAMDNSPISMPEMLKFAQGLSKENPMQNRQQIMRLHQERLAADAAHTTIYGTPTFTDTGGAILPQSTSSVTGVRPLAPPIPSTMSPGLKVQGQPAMIPDGKGGFVPAVIPNASRFTPTGNPLPASGGPLGTGRYPGAQGAQGAAPTGATGAGIPGAPSAGLPAPPGGIAGAVATQPPLGTGIGIEGGAQASTKLWGQASEAANNFKSRVYPLEQAIPALERLGKTGTGPGAEEINYIKSFLQSNGLGAVIPGGLDSIKDFDSAKKYLTQYASGQAGALGQGTDAKLATALTANPNMSISNLAAGDLAKSALALERMRQAQIMAFNATGQTPDKFANFSTEWNAKTDPRAFAIDLVKNPAKMISDLKSEDRDNFASSLRAAIKTGLVPAPRKPAASAPAARAAAPANRVSVPMTDENAP